MRAYQAALVDGGERSASCRAVSRSTRTIGPPQVGQTHIAAGSGAVVEMVVAADTGVSASSCLHNGTSAPRRRLARKPKWRIRTKPRGRT